MVNFAHYWGIDEVGVFLVPAVLGLWALRRVEKTRRSLTDKGDTDDS